MAFTTEPSGARLPRGKTSVPVSPRCARLFRRAESPRPRSTPSSSLQQLRGNGARRSDFSHQSRFSPSVFPVTVSTSVLQQIQLPQMQHHLRHAAREKDAHGRMMNRAVRQHADQARHAAIDGNPVLDRRPFQSGGVRDGGNVQQQIRRAAERRVNAPSRFRCWRRSEFRAWTVLRSSS